MVKRPIGFRSTEPAPAFTYVAWTQLANTKDSAKSIPPWTEASARPGWSPSYANRAHVELTRLPSRPSRRHDTRRAVGKFTSFPHFRSTAGQLAVRTIAAHDQIRLTEFVDRHLVRLRHTPGLYSRLTAPKSNRGYLLQGAREITIHFP